MAVRLEDGRLLTVPARDLVERDDATLFFSGSFAGERAAGSIRQASTEPGSAQESVVMPVVEEELQVDKRPVESGKVCVTKKVHEREEIVDKPLLQEEVEVERVPVNEVVDGPVPVRYEGETMVVPLLEEVLVVEKRLVLKEVLRITKRQSETHKPQRVTLRSEEVTVERLESEGQQHMEDSNEQPRSAVPSK